jgi:hypothetical protein
MEFPLSFSLSLCSAEPQFTDVDLTTKFRRRYA